MSPWFSNWPGDGAESAAGTMPGEKKAHMAMNAASRIGNGDKSNWKFAIREIRNSNSLRVSSLCPVSNFLRLRGYPGPFEVLRGGVDGEHFFVLNEDGADNAGIVGTAEIEDGIGNDADLFVGVE